MVGWLIGWLMRKYENAPTIDSLGSIIIAIANIGTNE
jgi:hypothetical protein